MSKDKYATICLPQMETIVSIILQISFAICGDWKIGKYRSNIPQFVLGNVQPCDALKFRPIASERRSLMHYKLRYLGCQSRYILTLNMVEPKTVSLQLNPRLTKRTPVFLYALYHAYGSCALTMSDSQNFVQRKRHDFGNYSALLTQIKTMLKSLLPYLLNS